MQLIRPFLLAAACTRGAVGPGPDQVGPARRLPGHQLPHREPAAVRRRRRQGQRRQAEDHRARRTPRCSRRPRSSARCRAGRRRSARSCWSTSRTSGRSSAPTACPSWPTATTKRPSCGRRRSRCSRRSSAEQGMMVLYAVPWPPQGIYSKKPLASAADLKGIKWRAYSPATAASPNWWARSRSPCRRPKLSQALATGVVESMMSSGSTGCRHQDSTSTSSTGTTPRPGCRRTR